SPAQPGVFVGQQTGAAPSRERPLFYARQPGFRSVKPLLDGDGRLFRQALRRFLRHGELQDAVLKRGGDVVRLELVAHIEAAAALAGEAFAAEVIPLFLLLAVLL